MCMVPQCEASRPVKIKALLKVFGTVGGVMVGSLGVHPFCDCPIGSLIGQRIALT